MKPAEHRPARTSITQRVRMLGRRGKLAAALAVLAALAVAAVIMLSVNTPEAPAPVQYPAVTGTLGEHLDQLQKSVEP